MDIHILLMPSVRRLCCMQGWVKPLDGQYPEPIEYPLDQPFLAPLRRQWRTAGRLAMLAPQSGAALA